MMKIRIADLPINWQDDFSSFVSGFQDETVCDPIMSVCFRPHMYKCHGIEYTDELYTHFLRLENGEFLCANDDWTETVVYSSRKNDCEHSLPLAAICSRFSYFDALLLHASFVVHNDSGILFTGHSGVGKTTQAELWREHLDAQIVNGDKAFIRNSEHGVTAYGLPWKGSSDYCVNKNVPIRGIVVLKQSDENRITRLEPKTAMEYFTPHVFFPRWDLACFNNTLDTIGNVLENVPVWLLECRPDRDAVMLTHDMIFN